MSHAAVVFSRRVLLRCAVSGRYEARPAAVYIGVDGRISDVVSCESPPVLHCATLGGNDTVRASSSRQEAAAALHHHPPRSSVHDLGDALVTPAFVNAHTHTPMHAFRGIGKASELQNNVVEDLFYRLESALQPGDVRAFARMGAFENLLSGVGTVWEHYYGGLEPAEAFRDVGICAVVSPTLQDLSGPGVATMEAEWQATLELIGDGNNEQRTGDVGGSGSFQQAGIVGAMGPHATDTVSDELWRRVVDTAAALQVPIHCHVAQSVEEYERSMARHGCSPVERLHRLGVLDAGVSPSATPSVLIVHNLFANDNDLRILRDAHEAAVTAATAGTASGSGVAMVLCPHAQAQFGFVAHFGR